MVPSMYTKSYTPPCDASFKKPLIFKFECNSAANLESSFLNGFLSTFPAFLKGKYDDQVKSRRLQKPSLGFESLSLCGESSRSV